MSGFDEMVEYPGGPFKVGERALLLGPSGSGKFQFGAQFLGAAASDERAVCVSFARPIEELREHLSSVPSSHAGCDGFSISATEMALEEMLGAIHNLLELTEPAVTRLFIDGLATLHHRFADASQYESFVRSLLLLTASFPAVATLVGYNTPRVFSSYAEMDIPVSDTFSTVIGFNFQEQYNRVVKGIVILKSHAVKYDSSLKVPVIENGLYAVNRTAGWAKVGLLSGDRERVHEERPFVKLFFENRSEHEVLYPPFEEFRHRYPGSAQFEMVGRHNPQPTHWSFRGYAGPGHSNTKLVQLRKYVMDELRDDELLLNAPDEMVEYVQMARPDHFDETFLWKDCTSRGPRDTSRLMIPAYADVGVLVYQADAPASKPLPSSWQDVIQLARHFDGSKRHLFVIPNIVGDSRNFVSFFFELSWTFGWMFPDGNICADSGSALRHLLDWIDGDHFGETVKLLRQMVEVGYPDAIPNPLSGGHYHESVFARRWFSKIHLLPTDADARAKYSGRKAFPFGIAPLPGVLTKDGRRDGVSNVDLYALGLIRGALAPETAWMLVSSLFEQDIDTTRAKRKRGLPISRKKFLTRLVQDNLSAPPPAPPKSSPGADKRGFYDGTESLFAEYAGVVKKILGAEAPHTAKRFKRTADIPKFFKVEQLLASQLPKMFDDPPTPDAVISRAIKDGLRRIYEG